MDVRWPSTSDYYFSRVICHPICEFQATNTYFTCRELFIHQQADLSAYQRFIKRTAFWQLDFVTTFIVHNFIVIIIIIIASISFMIITLTLRNGENASGFNAVICPDTSNPNHRWWVSSFITDCSSRGTMRYRQ